MVEKFKEGQIIINMLRGNHKLMEQFNDALSPAAK
jgi:hypothetical protein